MKHHVFALLIIASSPLVIAWLPIHKDLFSWQFDTNRPFINSITERTANDRGYNVRQRRRLGQQKIRGVNVGSLFIVEPWMASLEWTGMGCGDYPAESECVKGLGQDRANKAFVQHWNTWITEGDLREMTSYGLNTIRVPVGYWIREDLVSPTERFPQGALQYLERLCGWAANMQIYVVLDMHGTPGAQKGNASFTGVIVDEAGFYEGTEYARAYQFLSWMTELVHSNKNFSTVGMIEVVNEPIAGETSLAAEYYPGAMKAIRETEAKLSVRANDALTIQFMDRRWGAGVPSANLSRQHGAGFAYDNHHYLFAKDNVSPTRTSYIDTTCAAVNVSDSTPLVFGEWSLSVNDPSGRQFNPSSDGAKDFYKKWWAAQVTSYEKHEGWIWWTWKTDLNDFRWDYQKAVEAGVIPTDPTKAYDLSPC